jgi:uncharacterized membrane protein (DUF485 family)
MLIPIESATQAIAWTARICCVARAISLFELARERREMEEGGILNWSLSGLTDYESQPAFRFRIERITARLPQSFFTASLFLDACVVTVLFVFPTNPFLLFAAAFCLVLQMKRQYLSYDGADEMTLLCLVALGFGVAIGKPAYSALFIACEVCLAYCVAGIYKAASPYWKQGRALQLVTRTQLFGQQKVARLLQRNRRMTSIFELAFVLWESVFLIVLFVNPDCMGAMLLVGLVFHIACAWVMGLNTFLWAFAATYPCILFANQQVHGLLSAATCSNVAWSLGVGISTCVVILTAYIPRHHPLKENYGLETF